MKLYKKYSGWIKEYIHKVISIKTSPHEIALGFAVGTLVGIFPTPGFSIILGLFIIFVYPKMSKIALFAALILWNPFVTIPLNILSYKLGYILFGGAPVHEIQISFLSNVYHYTRRLLVGNIIIALVMSIVSYLLVFLLSSLFGKKRIIRNK